MTRPTLSLEDLVLRPGYVETLSVLEGTFSEKGATLPQLTRALAEKLEKTRKRTSVMLLHRLRRLEKSGIVRFERFDPEYRESKIEGADQVSGRPPSGRWVLTEKGKSHREARLSIQIVRRAAEAILSTPPERIHVPAVGTPTVLVANLEPVRNDFVGLRLLNEGPSLGLDRPAQGTALQEWARNPRIIAEWKSLQELRKKYPKDVKTEFSIPEYLALKAWHPTVRRAHRRVERHRLWIVLEVNPAYWDNLPIERLEELRREYVRAHRRNELARSRFRRKQEAKRRL